MTLAMVFGALMALLAACGGEKQGTDSAAAARERAADPATRGAAEAASQTPPAEEPSPGAAAVTQQSGLQAEVPEAAVASPGASAPGTNTTAAPSTATPASPAAAAAGEEQAAAEGEEAVPLPELTPVAQRPQAPAFTATDISGRQFALADLRGEVTLVVFWATWCRPCIMEIPHLVRLQEAYGAKGLNVLGLSIDRRGLAVVKPFLQAHPEINYTIVPNGLGAADAFGGISSIPTSVLIDRAGRVIRGFVGLTPGEVLEGYVQAALQEQG
jgi:thiol-disulfide isomerase/thioredoxin